MKDKKDIKQDILKKKDDWAINVIKQHYPESELAERLDERQELAEARDQLLENGIFIVSGNSETHSYIIHVDTGSLSGKSAKQDAKETVLEYADNAVVQTDDLLQDPKVEVLGEFQTGVITADGKGNSSLTVRSSTSGKINNGQQGRED